MSVRHARLGNCLWCGNVPPHVKKTIDHLVPRWVLRAFPHYFNAILAYNTFTACKSCNEKRGPMPAALFASARSDAGAIAKSTIYWHAVAQLCNIGKTTEFKEHVLDAFCAMIPDESGLRDPRVGVWPYKIVKLCSRAPSKEEWIKLAYGYDHIGIGRRATVEMIQAQPWYKTEDMIAD